MRNDYFEFKIRLFKVCTRVVHAAQSTYFNRTANQVIVRLVVLVDQFSTIINNY